MKIFLIQRTPTVSVTVEIDEMIDEMNAEMTDAMIGVAAQSGVTTGAKKSIMMVMINLFIVVRLR